MECRGRTQVQPERERNQSNPTPDEGRIYIGVPRLTTPGSGPLPVLHHKVNPVGSGS